MIAFEHIIGKTELYNLHTHTQFCDGRDCMESFVKEAIHQGFTDLGFSPHSPIPIESPCNMQEQSVLDYLMEIGRLIDIYGSQINIYVSMEIDYLGDWGPRNQYFNNLPLDYKIGSVHFIPSFENEKEFIDIDGDAESFKHKMSQYFHNDIKKVVESFHHQTVNMIETGGFDIIGHFDKIGHNANCFCPGIEDETWYQNLVRNTFEAIVDNKYIVEINTKAYQSYNRFFPNERYFKWLKRYDVPVIFNSDAHYSHLLNSGRREAMDIYSKI